MMAKRLTLTRKPTLNVATIVRSLKLRGLTINSVGDGHLK